MERRRKGRLLIMEILQALAAAAMIGASGYLFYRYIQYGESGAILAGTRPETEGQTKERLAESTDMSREKLPASVRVRILGDDFLSECHSALEVTCGTAYTVTVSESARGGAQHFGPGESYRIEAGELSDGQTVCISAADDAPVEVTSLTRADGHPQYFGKLFLYREEEGIALVNELPLEEYLCGVVSSEMPSDYPQEAQKAQAVCARTYACGCIRNANKKNLSDLDDSVNFQVYNNYRSSRQSRAAVEETAGEVLPLDGIQYYSTSCQSEHRSDLDSEAAFRQFLDEEPDAGAEYNSPWLRWETEIPCETILAALQEAYGWDEGRVDRILVAERSGNGQVQRLSVSCGEETVEVDGEYQIRRFLSPAQTTIRLWDGSETAGMQLLPSAFFYLEAQPEDSAAQAVRAVRIVGGGYGHGNGMSQCGAAALAEKGRDYRGILAYYYQCDVQRHPG